MWEQKGLLRQQRDPPRVRSSPLGNVEEHLVTEERAPAIRSQHPGKNAQQRRLTRTIASEDCNVGSVLDLNLHVKVARRDLGIKQQTHRCDRLEMAVVAAVTNTDTTTSNRERAMAAWGSLTRCR